MFSEGCDISEGSKTLAAVLDNRPDCSHKSMMVRSRRCMVKHGSRVNSTPSSLCPHCPARDKDDDGRLQPISPGHSLDVLCLPQAVRGSGDSGPGCGVALKGSEVICHQSSSNGSVGDQQDRSQRRFHFARLHGPSAVGGDGGQAQEHLKQGPLFSINYSTLNQHWKGALTAIGLKHNWGVFYQLRHSGPSHDRLHKLRSTLEVKLMGRWEADSSVKRYEAHSKLALEFQNLPHVIQQQALVAEKNLDLMMLRSQFRRLWLNRLVG